MCQNQKSSTAWVMFRQLSGCRRFDAVPAYHRRAVPCTRIKHLVTCRSQYHMHLLSFVPPPGLAHLPTQFAAWSSHRAASVTASADELRSTPMPMREIAKKRCRAMFEPPEKGERATLNPNLSSRLNLLFFDRARDRAARRHSAPAFDLERYQSCEQGCRVKLTDNRFQIAKAASHGVHRKNGAIPVFRTSSLLESFPRIDVGGYLSGRYLTPKFAYHVPDCRIVGSDFSC